ncbi:MAG: flagellar biosynthetic protein FliR, partial [Myxococcota bacterium]
MEGLVENLGGEEAVLRFAEALGASSTDLPLALLLLIRLGPFVFFAPLLGVRDAPLLLRFAVAVGLTAAFLPTAAVSGVVPTDATGWIGAVATELTLGLVFAVAGALPFVAVDWTGRLSDRLRGVFVDGSVQSSPLASLYLWAALAIFFVSGAHRVAIGAVAETLRTTPLGVPQTFGLETALSAGLLVSQALAFSVALLLPALAAVLLVELALSALARASPGAPVHFVGVPARSAAVIL